MKQLHCPWRENYSKSANGTKKEIGTEGECAFCTKLASADDEKNFIVKRCKSCAVILNLYPYNAGHLLVVPYRHIACLSDLDENERTQLMHAVTLSTDLLKSTLDAQGINVGLNLGRAAGAGIPSHLHMHVLPRWIGDTNFMPLIAETKIISFNMQEIYQKLKKAFNNS